MSRAGLALVLACAVATPVLGQSDTVRKAKALVALLGHEDPKVRDLAARELVTMGEDAVPELGRAVQALDARGGREGAASTLGALGSKARAAVPALVRAHADKYTSVREAAEAALVRIGPPEPGALAELAALVLADAEAVREAAALSLGRLGPAGAPAASAVLAGLAKGGEAGETFDAMYGALEKFGAGALPPLVAALENPAVAVRRRLVETIGAMGVAARTAAGALDSLAAKDPEEQVRLAALRALALVVPASPQLADACGRALADPSTALRAQAIAQLGALGPIASPIAGMLVERLDDPDPAIAAASARALGRIGKPAKPIALALAQRLGAAEGLRRAAAEGLAMLGEAGALAALPALVSADKAIRLEAIALVAKIGKPADKVAAALAARLTDPDAEVRLRAADALTGLGAAAAPIVLGLLAGADRDQRLLALRIAGHLGAAASGLTDELARAFRTIDPDVKNAARAALLRLAEGEGDVADRARAILQGG